MSYSAQGWALRIAVGAPAPKAVLQAMCYVMLDETLEVFASVAKLSEFTEYDQRTVRKAQRYLAEQGLIADTGKRRNNIVVWHLPRYEEWLTGSPPKSVSAANFETFPNLQDDDSSAEKTAGTVSDSEPPQKRQGLEPAPTVLQPSPDSSAEQALTKVSPNLLKRSEGSTKPARTIEEWKTRTRVLTDRAPEKASKDAPAGTLLKAHWRFWRKMVDLYGRLWLVQWGETPTPEFVRVLNIWNGGKWAELDQLLGDLVLDKPPTPAAASPNAIDALFRKRKKLEGPQYDELQSRRWWSNYILGHITSTAHLYGLGKYGITSLDQVDLIVREKLRLSGIELLEKTIAGEKQIPPVGRRVLEQRITDELNSVMQARRAPTLAETASEEAALAAAEA
jgi:hypothetical protein